MSSFAAAALDPPEADELQDVPPSEIDRAFSEFQQNEPQSDQPPENTHL